ncbi:hypothetical protein EDB84DRAFT_1185976 [Lactarius hengduanensis]|nr:hypothetical protein EDB84DRAFT_1185976 [Lactarius hengduanensis]
MHKLARIAKIIVGVGELCQSHNLSEEDLPAGLRAILDSLQRELDRIERVLKKCSKKKGLRGMLLRKDLLTKIKQCDVEISNVLQAFHAELSLDTRVALIAMRREAAPSHPGPIEAIPTASQEPNGARISLGTKGALDALWRMTLSAKELVIRPRQAILRPLPNKHHAITYYVMLPSFFFFSPR